MEKGCLKNRSENYAIDETKRTRFSSGKTGVRLVFVSIVLFNRNAAIAAVATTFVCHR